MSNQQEPFEETQDAGFGILSYGEKLSAREAAKSQAEKTTGQPDGGLKPHPKTLRLVSVFVPQALEGASPGNASHPKKSR